MFYSTEFNNFYKNNNFNKSSNLENMLFNLGILYKGIPHFFFYKERNNISLPT